MRRYQVEVGGRTHVVDVQEVTAHQFRVVIEGRELDVTLSAAEDVAEAVVAPGIAPTRASGADLSTARFRPKAPETLPPMVPAAPPPLSPSGDRALRSAITSPMPGTILSVETRPGDAVTTGQVLVKLEAMKMVNAIKAPHDAVIAAVRVQAGQTVAQGQVLVTFEEK